MGGCLLITIGLFFCMIGLAIFGPGYLLFMAIAIPAALLYFGSKEA